MGAITIQTSVPTSAPNVLGAAVAPLVTSGKFELALDIPSTISGSLKYQLMRWNADASKYYAVQGGEIEVGSRPALLGGQQSFVFDNPAPSYYLLVQLTPGTYATTGYLTELAASGAPAPAKLQMYTNPAAANTSAVHAAVQESAANAFPGPITQPPGVAGRNVTATFAAGWQGGDITVIGKDQFGTVISEVIADNAGNTVAGSKIFKEITSISKETVAGTTDDVTIGFGAKIGVPFQFSAAFVVQTDAGPPAVLDSATLDTTYYAFSPANAANGTRDFLFIGG